MLLGIYEMLQHRYNIDSDLTHSVPGVKKLSKFVENYNRRFSLHTDYDSRVYGIFIQPFPKYEGVDTLSRGHHRGMMKMSKHHKITCGVVNGQK